MKREKFFKKLKNIYASKYRTRILIAFLIIALLAMGFIDAAVFRGLSRQIQEDVANNTKEMLKNVTESYENQVAQYQDQAQLIYLNRKVKAYLTTGGKEDSHIDSIQDSMRALASNMTGISSVILFYKDQILTSYDTGMVLTEAKNEIVEKIQETKSDKEVLFAWTDNRKSKRQMVVFRSDREYLNGPSNFGVALVLSMDSIQEKVIPWNQKAENPIYIFHENGELVASQKNSYKEDVQQIFSEIQEKEENFNVLSAKINDKKQSISYVKTPNSRFVPVRILETSSSQEKMRKALQTILLSTALVMSLMVVIIWIVSGWMYRPLGELFRHILELSQKQGDEEKGELLLINDALGDVNLNLCLLKKQIKKSAVARFLENGQDEVSSEIFEFSAEVPKWISVMNLRYYMDNWEKNDALIAYLGEKENREGEKVKIRCYRMGRGELTLLVYKENGKLEEEETWAEALLMELKKQYEISGCIGIADSDSLEELPEAYRLAKQLTEYHILNKEILVISEEELKQKKEGAVQEPEREKILRYIREDVEENLQACVHRLLINLTFYQIETAQDYLKGLVGEAIRLSESLSGEKNIQSEVYLEDFLNNQIFIGQADIEDWLIQLFVQVKTQLKVGRQSNAFRIMQEVTVYIEEHYGDCGLSAEMVAEHFGLSVSYFSKLFNQYTEKTFPDYINQLRLLKAKEMLLEDRNRPISEIAASVGFNSSSYFSAAFRKYFGMSPSQIRKNI